MRPDLAACIRLVAGYFDCDAELWRVAGRSHMESRIRAFLVWVIQEKNSASLTELGKWLNRDVSTLSSSVRRLKENATKQPQISLEMGEITRRLNNFATLQA
jgi:chromosomal replication initiation ATPase DnaA